MKKIVGIVIITLLFLGQCFAWDCDCPYSTDAECNVWLYSTESWGKCLQQIDDYNKDYLKQLSWDKADLQSQFNDCTNKIDASLFSADCDIDIISWALQNTLTCFDRISLDDKKKYKTLRDDCINLFEKEVQDLQKNYDSTHKALIAYETNRLSWDVSNHTSNDEYKENVKKKIAELEEINNQIQTWKNNIQTCKILYEDIQDLQKDIKNTMGDIEKQQKSLTKAENKNQKKKDKNSNQEANSLRDTSKSVEKAENKRKEKDEKADYALNQACLSARDFLYTLKYGTTMKKGNPWNDLIENRSPREMLDKVVYDANAIDQYQETAMDGVTSRDESCINGWGRITNTLCWVKNHIHPYIQWIVYLGLTLSVILLIYNGFKMVTNVMHGEGDFWKIKTNILYIGLWIIILTWFYYLLDIVMAIINFLFD